MTIREAAILVLEAAGRPLHVKEITESIVSKKLWETSGKTPEDSVSSTINEDIKKKGRNSPFARTAPATFELRKGQGEVYSYGDSAEKVLEMFGGKQPMHYKEITDKAIEEGWLVSGSLTPEASMYAQILTEIERCVRRGKQSRFVKHGKGFVGLSKWMARGLAFEIENHNRKVHKELHKRLLKMDWKDFERLTARLLAKIGFDEIEVTGKVDGGIDVRGTLVVGDVIRIRMAVQVKRWKKENVQTPIVQQVRGSLGPHEQGLIITTGDFSKGARENAAKPEFKPVALMNGKQLVALLVENGIGVELQSHDLIELDEDTLLGDE